MTEIKKIVFWQPVISPHYVPMLRELCQLFEDVVLVAVQEQRESRKKQGWILPNTELVRAISLEHEDGVITFEKENSPNTLHIFSGTRAYKPIWRVFKLAIRQKALCAIVGETLDWHGIKGLLRFLISKYDAWFIRNQISFVLAKGTLGVWWYNSVGYPLQKIFEWGYFVENNTQATFSSQDDIVRFIYAGRLSKEKGVIWMLKTFQKVTSKNFELHLVGDGPLREECMHLSEEIPHGKVTFHGQTQMNEMKRHYDGKDYLILPSTGKDGWGAVVNEALLNGIPCIVSKKCGASTVLRNESLGFIIDPKNQDSLLLKISHIVQNKIKPDQKQRNYIRRFSNNLNSTSGALYLKSIIDYTVKRKAERPLPPWKKV